VFLVRAVCHDLPTDKAVIVLRRLREAAQKNTVLVLGDQIMPYACVDTSSTSDLPGAKKTLAPPPLVANYGKGGATSHYFDLTVRS
jgi:hypothetical protein